MANPSVNGAAPWKLLQIQDYGELLNVIDLLRSLGVGHYVELPQLIVCGDQSSGKSSVLEAISRVKFPAKDTLCTRFATELILRRTEVSSIDVTIIPGDERSNEEIRQLANFKSPGPVDSENFGSLVDSAKNHLDSLSGQTAFTEDVLRVEISGADLPNVTLVDLPGFIHAKMENSSTSDVELVARIVRRYMTHERSIILAVVSAKNDYANQIVTTYARQADPTGRRTLGIITKPDDLSKGSESEKAFLELANNKSAKFRLGWHVLRNRDYESRGYTSDQRDQQEAEFFEKSPWNTLPRKVVGIEALNVRLSKILNDHILSEMPSLIKDIEREVTDAKMTLARLGQARGTPAERRTYLVQIAQSFSLLLHTAIDGIYSSDFFGAANDPLGSQKRFRAVVQNTLTGFSKEINRKGHSIKIVPDTSEPVDHTIPREMSRSDFLEDIRSLIRKTRGKELPGTFNPLIIGDLFFEQAKPWGDMLTVYTKTLLTSSRDILDLVAKYTADETTKNRVIQDVIDPAMEICASNVEKVVGDILRPYQRGHAITYNHYFTETVQKARRKREKNEQEQRLRAYFSSRQHSSSVHSQPSQESSIQAILHALEPPPDVDMELHACSEALDYMQAYYKVAMKVIVDNFAVLVVEKTLLEFLPKIFSPEVVMGFDDAKIEAIASESEDAVLERSQAEKKLRSLQAGLDTLQRFQRLRLREAVDMTPLDAEVDSPKPTPKSEHTRETSLDAAEPPVVPNGSEQLPEVLVVSPGNAAEVKSSPWGDGWENASNIGFLPPKSKKKKSRILKMDDEWLKEEGFPLEDQ